MIVLANLFFILALVLSQTSLAQTPDCVRLFRQLWHELHPKPSAPLRQGSRYENRSKSKGPIKPLSIAAESLAAKYPELIEELNLLRGKLPFVGKFVADFSREKGRIPTVAEVGEYVLSQRNLLSQEAARLKELHRQKAVSNKDEEIIATFYQMTEDKTVVLQHVRENFLARVATHPDQFNAPYSAANPLHRQLSASMNAASRGELGEFEFALKMNHIFSRGLRFSESNSLLAENREMARHVSLVMSELREKAALNKNLIAELRQNFPILFAKILRRDGQILPPLESVEAWIASKELDLVGKNPVSGKKIWIEVKALSDTLTLTHLEAEYDGKKSYLTQILETKELRRFLGLENDIELAVAFQSGCTTEVKDKLKQLGIDVIGEVRDF